MAHGPTKTTGLRSVSRIHVGDPHPLSFCFVGNKLTQLIKRPSMQPRANSFVCSDPQADVFQILKHNLCAAISFGFLNKSFGNTMVYIGHMPSFSARDLPQPLFCRLRTVALKTAPMSQKFVSFSSQRCTTKYLTGRGSRQIIFPKIDCKNLTTSTTNHLWKIKNKMEKPPLALTDKLCLFDRSSTQILCMIGADIKEELNPSLQGIQRENSFFERIGPFIKMDRDAIAKKNLFRLFQSFQGLGDFANRITAHLRAKLGKFFSKKLITQVMETNPMSFFLLQGNCSYFVTGSAKVLCKLTKSPFVFFRRGKFDGNCPFHERKGSIPFIFKKQKKERHFLPPLKEWVSVPSLR